MNLSFSEALLSGLDSDIMTQHHVASVSEGLDAIKNGSDWTVLHFGANFSQDSLAR